jgi:hypothetical protein
MAFRRTVGGSQSVTVSCGGGFCGGMSGVLGIAITESRVVRVWWFGLASGVSRWGVMSDSMRTAGYGIDLPSLRRAGRSGFGCRAPGAQCPGRACGRTMIA